MVNLLQDCPLNIRTNSSTVGLKYRVRLVLNNFQDWLFRYKAKCFFITFSIVSLSGISFFLFSSLCKKERERKVSYLCTSYCSSQTIGGESWERYFQDLCERECVCLWLRGCWCVQKRKSLMEKEDERADVGERLWEAQSVSRCMSMSVGVLYLECECYGVKRERERERKNV